MARGMQKMYNFFGILFPEILDLNLVFLLWVLSQSIAINVIRQDDDVIQFRVDKLKPFNASDPQEIKTDDDWDLVEKPSLPPPPSMAEDVEHWTRAMFLDAKK